MFDLSSFLRRDSQKPVKSTRRGRDSRDHEPPHHKTSEHRTQSHHSRRQDRDHRPEYPSEPRYSNDNDEQDSQLRQYEDADRRRYYSRHDEGPYRRDSYREQTEDRDRRGVDKGNDNERARRQSERRMGDREYRSPSLSRALHSQPGDTGQEMQDRVDGRSRHRPKYDSEQEPSRRGAHGQEEESLDRRSMPRRPRFTTTTSYRIPDKDLEDAAPGPPPRSATWPSKEPSQRPKPCGERSHLRESDKEDPSDRRSHRKRDREPARSFPLAHDGPTITPLHRGYTASTTSGAYNSGLAGWVENRPITSAWTGANAEPERLGIERFESRPGKKDRFRRSGQENLVPYDQKDELTRCYFPTIGDFQLRLKASEATTLTEFADIVAGMKEGYLRVSTHARQTDMIKVPRSEAFRPANRPLYVAFAKRLDDDFEEAERTMRTISVVSPSESVTGTGELEASEARATRGLREQYGLFGSHTAKGTTRKTYKYPDAGK